MSPGAQRLKPGFIVCFGTVEQVGVERGWMGPGWDGVFPKWLRGGTDGVRRQSIALTAGWTWDLASCYRVNLAGFFGWWWVLRGAVTGHVAEGCGCLEGLEGLVVETNWGFPHLWGEPGWGIGRWWELRGYARLPGGGWRYFWMKQFGDFHI